MARREPFQLPVHAPAGLRFLNDEAMADMFRLSKDLEPVAVEINRLDNQVLVRYHEAEWRHWE